LDNAQLGNTFSFVTNRNDPVPTAPPRFLDFQHSQGETHIINNPTSVVSCPGQENDNCIGGNSLLDINVKNHIGDCSFSERTFILWLLTVLPV
jgi:hypothetical protein